MSKQITFNMKKKKLAKKINKRIKEWESESVDDVNVQSKQKPLTAKQIVNIGKSISWYESKITNLKEILKVLS